MVLVPFPAFGSAAGPQPAPTGGHRGCFQPFVVLLFFSRKCINHWYGQAQRSKAEKEKPHNLGEVGKRTVFLRTPVLGCSAESVLFLNPGGKRSGQHCRGRTTEVTAIPMKFTVLRDAALLARLDGSDGSCHPRMKLQDFLGPTVASGAAGQSQRLTSRASSLARRRCAGSYWALQGQGIHRSAEGPGPSTNCTG